MPLPYRWLNGIRMTATVTVPLMSKTYGERYGIWYGTTL